MLVLLALTVHPKYMSKVINKFVFNAKESREIADSSSIKVIDSVAFNYLSSRPTVFQIFYVLYDSEIEFCSNLHLNFILLMYIVQYLIVQTSLAGNILKTELFLLLLSGSERRHI